GRPAGPRSARRLTPSPSRRRSPRRARAALGPSAREGCGGSPLPLRRARRSRRRRGRRPSPGSRLDRRRRRPRSSRLRGCRCRGPGSLQASPTRPRTPGRCRTPAGRAPSATGTSRGRGCRRGSPRRRGRGALRPWPLGSLGQVESQPTGRFRVGVRHMSASIARSVPLRRMSSPTIDRDPRIAPLPAAEIRRRFVEFFAERGDTHVPSASLVPAGDQTLLFTNSGMVQFKEVFTGAEKRSYTRAVDYQRCLRVAGKHNDFEEVGRTPRHHSFFEMLGNWSFGDYFKRDAILWAWTFLTRDLGIPGDRLAATTYTYDDVAWHIWRDEIGLPPERMARWGDVEKGDDKNFWRMAELGPCAPCSEIHYDRGAHLSEGPECIPDHSEHCPRWLEIWTLVFMEFDQRPDGRVLLPFPSVDTGMGLERLASVLQQVPS